MLAIDIIAAFLYANTTLISWIGLLILALAVYQISFVILPRLRDVGMSGWWLLLIFVPFANGLLGLILLFRKPMLLSPFKPETKPEPVYSSVDDVL